MKPLRKLRTAGARGLCAVLVPGLLGLLLPVAGISATPDGTGGASYAPPTSPYTSPTATPTPSPNPLANRAMWIWELPSTDHGKLTKILAQAKTAGIKTVMIKSSDGTSMWSQFTPQMVAAFHQAQIKVCAWQYVYGNEPLREAALGGQAVKDGADCLLIDAEGEYEGKYVSAQTYMTTLRQLIGKNFPVALAGLPYIDYHPAFPYSVFLGPGGAQYDMPQMYWYTIGTSVDDVFAHTYEFNLLYGRPIFPLGQVYGSPPAKQVLRFRQVSRLYQAPGVSWWDWQEAAPKYFTAISRPIGALHGVTADETFASLGKGAQGDVVVWAQEHLDGAGLHLNIDGAYGKATQTAVAQFQALNSLPATGTIDATTWAALLKVQPITVKWAVRKKKVVAITAAAIRHGTVEQLVPRSASLPDRGRDIPPSLGAGN
jgi:hypothetical protein